MLALTLAGLVAAAACSDDPVGLDDHDHDVDGVQLVLEGVVVAEYDHGAWTGELEVLHGAETARIDVVFVDHDGDEVAPGGDFYLAVDVGDEGVAVWTPDAPGAFSGRLGGVAPGETEAVFSLMHGAVGSGHADFQTAGVLVRVVGVT